MENSVLDNNLIEEKKQITDGHVASGGRRFGNYIIDRILIQIYFYGIAFLLGDAVNSNGMPSKMMGLFPLVLLTIPAYYILMEYYFGKTIGKMITKTRVVDMNGERPTLGATTLRTLCRIIPFEAFSFLGTPCVGWHDKLTKTRVIDDF